MVNIPAVEDRQQIVRGINVENNSLLTSHDPTTVATGISKAYDLEKTLPDTQTTKNIAGAPVPSSSASEAV